MFLHLEGFPVHELKHTESRHNSAIPMGSSPPQANPKASINLLIAPLGSLQGEEADCLGSKVSRSQHLSAISYEHLRATVGISHHFGRAGGEAGRPPVLVFQPSPHMIRQRVTLLKQKCHCFRRPIAMAALKPSASFFLPPSTKDLTAQ